MFVRKAAAARVLLFRGVVVIGCYDMCSYLNVRLCACICFDVLPLLFCLFESKLVREMTVACF